MSPTESEKFVQRFIRISNSVPLIGCGFSKNIKACIEERLRDAIEYWEGQLEEASSEEEMKDIKWRIRQHNITLNSTFAEQVSFNFWLDANPIFKERLGNPEDIKDVKENTVKRLRELEKLRKK